MTSLRTLLSGSKVSMMFDTRSRYAKPVSSSVICSGKYPTYHDARLCVSLNLQLPFWIRKRIVFCREPWLSYLQEAHSKLPNADDIRSHPRLRPACDRLLEHNKRGLSRSERIKAVKAYIGRDPLGVAHCRSRILLRTNGSEIRFPA